MILKRELCKIEQSDLIHTNNRIKNKLIWLQYVQFSLFGFK